MFNWQNERYVRCALWDHKSSNWWIKWIQIYVVYKTNPRNSCKLFCSSLDYSQMKKIKLFLDSYPKLENIEAINFIVQMTYIKLKTIFRCRLYRAFHGREARLKRYTGWKSLFFMKRNVLEITLKMERRRIQITCWLYW